MALTFHYFDGIVLLVRLDDILFAARLSPMVDHSSS
jgi:hypothetical protein